MSIIQQRKFIYGPGLDEPIMMTVTGDSNETVYYYHADHLGSVIGLTNDAGAWTEKYAYTLYGKPAAPSTVGNPYMYTGRRFDTETGLYYYRARYYDSNLRRFLQPDPIGYLGGLNLYTYVRNSPVNFVDPLGLEAMILPGPVPLPIIPPKTEAQIVADEQLVNGIWNWMTTHYNEDNWVVQGWNWLFGHCQITAPGNHADTKIVQLYGEYASEERLHCRQPKDPCEWLNENKKLFTKKAFHATTKAWGCRHSRVEKDKRQ